MLKSIEQDNLFVKCFIFDVEVNCLIDTGSTTCVLHPRKYLLLPKNVRPEIQKSNKQLCLADGSVVNTLGMVDLPIQVGEFTTVQKFTLADVDVPAVIGYDFLNGNRCTIDIGEGMLHVNMHKIQCTKESQVSSLFKIKLAEKVIIPPNSEIITSGKVDGDSSSVVNGLIQPLTSKHAENVS